MSSPEQTTAPRKRPAESAAHKQLPLAKKPTTAVNRPGAPPATANTSATTTTSSKAYKGLRHFSMMVCKKVEEKGVTSYNEVADELVQQVVAERKKMDPSSKYDEKNIRRRVYDALNVLMAMDIITKEKKAISWKGLPTSAHADLDMLLREKEYRQQEVERKREALRELLTQQVCFRNLVALNQGNAKKAATSAPSSSSEAEAPSGKGDHKIPLPFIVVNTHTSAVIQCNMSRDLTDVMFDFSQPFEINDDNTILKRMGMHKTNRETLEEMLPEDLMAYADSKGMLKSLLEPTSPSEPPPPPVLATSSSYPGTRGTASYNNHAAAH